MRSFSKRKAFAFGWQRFKERPFFLIGIFLITTVVSGLSGYVAEEVGTGGMGVVISLLDFAIQLIVGMGMTLILLRVHDNVDTHYADFIEPLHLFWKYLAMTVLVLVIVLIGFLLLIIPGVIASIALAFASYLVIDRNLGPVEAIKESVRITNGHRWNLLMFGLLVGVFNLIGALFLGVGLLITVPVSALASVHVYRWLSNPPESEGVEVSMLSKIFTTLVILVAVGAIVLVVLATSAGSLLGGAEVRDVERRGAIAEIRLGAAMYQDFNGTYPATLDELFAQEYMTGMVYSDASDLDQYTYTLYADGVDYEICTQLEAVDETYCEYGLEVGAVPVGDTEEVAS